MYAVQRVRGVASLTVFLSLMQLVGGGGLFNKQTALGNVGLGTGGLGTMGTGLGGELYLE